jgi:hypothetical protein
MANPAYSPTTSLHLNKLKGEPPMLKQINLILLVILSFSAARAQKSPYAQPVPGVVCPTGQSYCEYTVVNAPRDEVYAEMIRIVLGGIGITSNEVLLSTPGPQTIRFSHTDPKKFDEMKNLLPVLDKLPTLYPSPLVKVTVDVYAATEDALSRISAELTSIGSGVGEPTTSKGISKTEGGGLTVGMNFGSIKFNALIGAERGRQEAQYINTIERNVPIHMDIGYSNIIEIKRPVGTSIETQTQYVGLKVDGKVGISDGEDPIAYIQNFSLSYGQQSIGLPEQVKEMRVNQPRLDLIPGLAFSLVSETNTVIAKSSSFGLFKFGKSSQNSNARLVVVLKARPMTYKEYIAETKVLMGHQDLNPTFNEEELAGLPEGENLDEIIDSLKPFAYPIAGGASLIGFRFDKTLATKQTRTRQLMIEVKTSGLKVEQMKSVENLMIGDFRLPPLPQKALTKAKVELRVRIKELKTGKIREINLIFNPSTYAIFPEGQ